MLKSRVSAAVTDLDADGVADAAQELEVGAVQLPRALAAPQEVAAAVVPAPSTLCLSLCYQGNVIRIDEHMLDLTQRQGNGAAASLRNHKTC